MAHRRRGRPPIAEVSMKATIQLRVTDAQRLELRRIAHDSGSGLSCLIREAVTAYVAEFDERRPFLRRG